MVSKLQEKEESDRDSEFIYETFLKLVKYTKEHFSTEEKLMTENKYSELDRHKREHELFIKKISGYLKNCNKNNFDVSSELTEFLQRWFIHDILENDIAFSK